MASKAKEEIFLKNNLEYEQRLKHHLYQFEDENEQLKKRRGNQSIDDSQVSERQESRAYNHHEGSGAGDETHKLNNQQVN